MFLDFLRLLLIRNPYFEGFTRLRPLPESGPRSGLGFTTPWTCVWHKGLKTKTKARYVFPLFFSRLPVSFLPISSNTVLSDLHLPSWSLSLSASRQAFSAGCRGELLCSSTSSKCSQHSLPSAFVSLSLSLGLLSNRLPFSLCLVAQFDHEWVASTARLT